MIRFLNIALAFVCSLASITMAGAMEPQVGRCLEETCVWTRVLSKDLVQEKNGAILYRVKYQEGIASRTNAEGHSRQNDVFSESKGLKDEIGWYSPSEEYVFCSNRLPIVYSHIARVVPLTAAAQTYGKANILSVYAPVCHNASVKEFLTIRFQRDHNYTMAHFDKIMLNDPKLLFELLDPETLLAYKTKQ